jgi:curved DNA-binding protein CbpA
MISSDTFYTCATVEEVKILFRKLARQHHPDLGGNTQDMQDLNRLYHQRLSQLDGAESVGSDGNVHTYKYNSETEEAVAEQLAAILKAAAAWPERIKILLIGLWIWIDGTEREDTEVIEALKAAGFQWQRHRACWAWKPYPGRSRRSSGDIEQLARRYGCQEFAGKAAYQKARTYAKNFGKFALVG